MAKWHFGVCTPFMIHVERIRHRVIAYSPKLSSRDSISSPRDSTDSPFTMLISDGEIVASLLCILDDNPKPNLLFGAPVSDYTCRTVANPNDEHY